MNFTISINGKLEFFTYLSCCGIEMRICLGIILAAGEVGLITQYGDLAGRVRCSFSPLASHLLGFLLEAVGGPVWNPPRS